MGQKTAGDCYIKVDGDQLVVSGGCEAPLTDTTRETVVPGYFSEKERTPYIKCDAVDTPNFPRAKLAEGTNMTVTCEFKNGKTYVLTGAYLVGDRTTSGDDAKAGLEFHGIKGTWQ